MSHLFECLSYFTQLFSISLLCAFIHNFSLIGDCNANWHEDKRKTLHLLCLSNYMFMCFQFSLWNKKDRICICCYTYIVYITVHWRRKHSDFGTTENKGAAVDRTFTLHSPPPALTLDPSCLLNDGWISALHASGTRLYAFSQPLVEWDWVHLDGIKVIQFIGLVSVQRCDSELWCPSSPCTPWSSTSTTLR